VSDDMRERIMEATYECVARSGLAKTTVEDVARNSELSRATIYRYFPGGKDDLIQSVVAWEARRFFLRLALEVAGAGSLGELVSMILMRGQAAVEAHEVLQTVLQTEPDLLLRQLSVEGERVLKLIRLYLGPYLEKVSVPDAIPIEGAADYIARMILSYITAPGSWDLADQEQVDELVKTQILGWLTKGLGNG